MTFTPSRNRMLAKLHALKREQGLDDDTYRAKLTMIAGKASAAELDDTELKAALDRFRTGATRTKASLLPNTGQARLLQAQWISLWNLGAVEDRSDAALMAWVRRQTGLDAAVWLKTQADYVKVIEPLKEWLAREGVDWSRDKFDPPHQRLASYKVCVAQWRKLIELGAARLGKTWSGRDKHWSEGLDDYARALQPAPGQPWTWDSPAWAMVSKALGIKLRAALKKKEKAA